MRGVRLVLAGVAMSLGVAGCAGTRIEHGVFQSSKGYRVAVPADGWVVVPDSRADLELRHVSDPAAMAVNASCDDTRPRGSLDVLARHLLIGLRDRSPVDTARTIVNGRDAEHAIVEGRPDQPGAARVKVEVYVMRDARCLYDFLYTAPPETFDASEPAFRRLVDTFVAQ